MHNAVAVTRCLSVRLSVRLLHADILSKRLCICSNTIPGFPHQLFGNILTRPYTSGACGGVECKDARGYEKIAICDQYLALSPKWYKIEPLLWKANRTSVLPSAKWPIMCRVGRQTLLYHTVLEISNVTSVTCVTSNPGFNITIYCSTSTRKWTNRKSYGLSISAIFNDLELLQT